MKSPVKHHAISINGRKTSISVDEEFWEGLKHIALERHQTLGHLIISIDADRKRTNLSSAIRVFVLECYRDQLDRRGGMVD